jgi:PAS domain S-box-containing protein
VLSLLLRGLENKQIAAELGIAEQSVKQHVSAMLARFAVPNRAALAMEVGSVLELTGALGIDRSWIHQLFREAEMQICILRGPDLRYEAVNEAFRKAIGDRPLLGRTMREAFPELEGQGIFERVERVYATGQPDIEHERTSSWDRGHGIERRSVNLVLQPLRAEDGTVNGVLSFAIDVTELVSERKRDAILREEIAAVLDLVTSGVIVTDADGRIVKVNRAAQQIARTPFDVTRPIDEQAGETFRIRDAEGRPLAADELPVTRALRGETLLMADYRVDRGDPAGDVLVRASVRPLRDVGGRVRGAILVFNELEG